MEEAGRGSLDDTKTITLEVDADDWRDINKAISKRQLMRIMPAGAGNMSGRLLGEICRGWLEMLQLDGDDDPEDREGEEWKS